MACAVHEARTFLPDASGAWNVPVALWTRYSAKGGLMTGNTATAKHEGRGLREVVLAIVVLATLGVARDAALADSTSFTVNSNADPGNGVCDANECTLREALAAANASLGPDRITFAVGTGAITIAPRTALPRVTDPVDIDGTTQPGYTDRPIVELSGRLGPRNVHGLEIAAGPTTVRGLVINRFGTVAPGAMGILVRGSQAVGIQVKGNYLGTDVTGTVALPNGVGVAVVEGSNTVIGGTTPADRNVISGNQYEGVRFQTALATSNVVVGNYIGTDVSGTKPLGSFDGVRVKGSPNNVIGGVEPGAGNVISGNHYGLRLNENARGNRILGNLIGLGAAGTSAVPNTTAGLWTKSTPQLTVGGTSPGAGNVISGNGIGIDLGTRDAVVQGNRIGTDVSGVAPVPNTTVGIRAADRSTIGGLALGAGNVVAFNGTAGVLVEGGSGVAIRGNSIHSNGVAGIDLAPSGVTLNDPSDADVGANNLQNFPVMTGVRASGSEVTVDGALSSKPNGTYTIEVFTSGVCDSSGYGEGESLLGRATVMTDGTGQALFSVTGPALASAAFTATATDAAGSTSEFGPCAG